MEKQSAIVVKLPETFNATGARRLKRELKNKMSNGAPRVVIDLSKVKNIDRCGEKEGAITLDIVPEASDGVLV